MNPVPAFPTSPNDNFQGMTLRDYFAAQALLMLIGCDDDPIYPYQSAAVKAYEYADAMLAERKRKGAKDV